MGRFGQGHTCTAVEGWSPQHGTRIMACSGLASFLRLNAIKPGNEASSGHGWPDLRGVEQTSWSPSTVRNCSALHTGRDKDWVPWTSAIAPSVCTCVE